MSVTSEIWQDLQRRISSSIAEARQFDISDQLITRDEAISLARETQTRCSYSPASGRYVFFVQDRIGSALLDGEIA